MSHVCLPGPASAGKWAALESGRGPLGGWYDGEDGSQGGLMGDGNEHVRMVSGGWGFREDPEGAQKVTDGEWKEESTLAFLTCPPLCSRLMGPGERGGGLPPGVYREDKTWDHRFG